LRWWGELDDDSRLTLLSQLRKVQLGELSALADGVRKGRFATSVSGKTAMPEYINLPRTVDDELERECARRRGERLLREGKVAALVVAGGQGTRLGFDGPKGSFPIAPVSGKSLFQIHAERILAAQRRYQSVMPWYIMTSEATDAPTRRFFEEHSYFGLAPRDVMFFRQGMMPALDRDFRLVLVARDRILLSPNGHGGTFGALHESGMFNDMCARGIEEISYFQVDNPLAPAADPVFLGFHSLAAAEMSSKAVWKSCPEEPMGAFTCVDGRLMVREYSDLSEEQMHERNEDGLLVYGLGSPAVHIICLEFVRRQAEAQLHLPWHLARKSSPWLNPRGELVEADGKNVYKFEMFIFDALAHAERSVILEVIREHEFSPVKNAAGNDSPDTARAQMCRLYADWLAEAGMQAPRDEDGQPRHAIEISPLYALDFEELVHRAPHDLDFSGPVYLEQGNCT